MNKIRILLAEDERDLAGILHDTLVTLDFAVTLAHDGAAALEAYAAERPDLLVTNDLAFSTDRLMLRDLLNNLIDNAIKYSNEEAVVDIRAWRDEAARAVIIEVADQGVGIAARDLRKVFRRFYRVEQGDLHTVRGYGLGLYHVDCLVRQLGGRISVQSEVGQGSCFRVVLPLDAASQTS